MNQEVKYSTGSIKKDQRHIPWLLILIFLLLCVVTLFLGKKAYDDISASKVEDIHRELRINSELNVIQITSWYNHKISDANLFLINPVLFGTLQEFFSSKNPAQQKENIKKLFSSYTNEHGYKDIYLLDSSGNLQISSRENNTIPSHAYLEIATAPKYTTTPYVFDIHRGEPENLLEMDIFIPINKINEHDTIYLGALLFQIDVRELMKPLLESSILASKTYETVFFRQYGDSVQVLNDLRFKPNSALNIFIPLSDTNFPGVQTVLGKRGIIYGLDYRRKEVISYASEIPNTNWFLITKIDQDEVLSGLSIYFLRIFIVIVSIIVLSGIILLLVWRRREIKHYKRYYDTLQDVYAITKRYEYLTKNANDAIMILDASFKIIDVNEKAIEMYGYKRPEFLYMTPENLRTEKSALTLKDDLKKLEETGSLLKETEHKKKNNEPFPVEISMKMIHLENTRYYVSINRDITERKKAENEIKLAERKYRLLTENITDFILRLDKTDKIIFANSATSSLIKNQPKNIEGKHLIDFVFDSVDIQILSEKTNNTFSTKEINHHTFDFIKGGKRFIFDCVFIPELDDNKNVQCVLVTMRDITHTKLIEESLIESEKLYRATFEEASVGIAHISLDSGFIENNKMFSLITGYYPEELQKLKYSDITYQEDFKKDREQAEKLLRGEIKHYSMEQRYIRKDKSTIWVNLTVALIRNADHSPAYFIIVVEDISKRKAAEEALIENEKKFRTLIEHSTILFYTHSTEHIVTYVSPQITKFFDCTPEEAMINWTNFATDNTLNEIGYYLTQKAIDTGITQPPYELELKGMKGRIVWVEVHESPIVVNGKTVAMVGSLTDITYRKKAEQELIQTKDLLEKITTTTPTIITVFDTTTETNIFKNRSLLEVLGYPKEVIKSLAESGFSRTSLLHPDDEDLLNESYEKIEHLKSDEIYEFEYRLKNYAGEWQWIRRLTNVFKHDENGKPIQVLNIFENITERKKAEIEVRKLSEAIRQSPVIVFITDTIGNIEFVNPGFTKITGYKPEEVIGKNPRILKSGINPEDVYTDLWFSITNGKVWEGEICNRNKYGELYWALYTISPLKNEKGEVTNFIAVSEDITEKKKRDQQIISSLKEKETLLREIHHRVKNNFQVISSLLKMQSDYIKDQGTKEHLKVSRDRIKSMALIHEQLYQANNLNYIDFRTYLQKLITQAHQLYKTVKNIDFNITADDILLNIDTAIPLGLIVNELVSNSFKYAFEGKTEGTIDIIFEKFNEDSKYKLIYKDSGIGLPENIDFTKTTSLGMQLVISLTEQLEGSIDLIKGNGAHFEITFKQLEYKQRF